MSGITVDETPVLVIQRNSDKNPIDLVTLVKRIENASMIEEESIFSTRSRSCHCTKNEVIIAFDRD